MKNYHSFLVFLLVILTGRLFAQAEVEISTPQLELTKNTISINYEIVNSSRNDLFYIWIEVTDTTGNRIDAKNLSGDIGENIRGGGRKRIEWDLTADSMYLDAGIYIQVYGEKKIPLVAGPKTQVTGYTNPYIAMGQSIILPGWGLSRSTGKKLHIVAGVLGYSCLTASVVFNRIGISTYEKYRTTGDMSQVEGLYNKSVLQDDLSEAFAYSAIGIWAADLIWTYAVVAGKNKSRKSKHADMIMIQPVFNPGFQSPMLGLRYTF
jgi:hypothetical protein